MNNELDRALADCAQEPVHIPGAIQPFGALLAIELATGSICYLSATAGAYLGGDVASLLGASARDVLGREAWHELQNARADSTFATTRRSIGTIKRAGVDYDLHGFLSGEYVVIEVEPATSPLVGPEVLAELNRLTLDIQQHDSEQQVLIGAVRSLRALTGYDRVMAYRFDNDFNGEVIAEVGGGRASSFLGLRFPHWDIPAQAREIMRRVPLRFIADVDAPPVPILAQTPQLPPLDITLGHLRGVSPIHLQYLRNMGAQATMTLSIVLDGNLWGMISFHHPHPRVPSTHARQLCCAYQPILCAKLQICLQKTKIEVSESIENLRTLIQQRLDEVPSEENFVADCAPMLLEAFAADGMALFNSGKRTNYGHVPSDALMDRLIGAARALEHDVLTTINLTADFGATRADRRSIAGALVAALPDNRSVCLFRRDRAREVRWAGAPEKSIEFADGATRISPRGSFATYVQATQNESEPWLQRDVKLVKVLAYMLLANARRTIIAASRRQQKLMIDELNHRVRNILALIQSISQQARSHNSSLASYSKSLEQRINALAAAHNIGSGQAMHSVSLFRLIAIEAQPFCSAMISERVQVKGVDAAIAAEAAPMVALVVHELMTNAAKYGALTADTGLVDVTIARTDEGVELSWQEIGGPEVIKPIINGFGTTLIEQAVPYELHGKSTLYFDRSGVRAMILLPTAIIDDTSSAASLDHTPMSIENYRHIPPFITNKTILLVEDNFVIATSTVEILRHLGFEDIEIASSANDGLEVLAAGQTELAIVDVNLGRGGSSVGIANELAKRSIPFFFVTGYGEQAPVPQHLADRPILAKPVSISDLSAAIVNLFDVSAQRSA